MIDNETKKWFVKFSYLSNVANEHMVGKSFIEMKSWDEDEAEGLVMEGKDGKFCDWEFVSLVDIR